MNGWSLQWSKKSNGRTNKGYHNWVIHNFGIYRSYFWSRRKFGKTTFCNENSSAFTNDSSQYFYLRFTKEEAKVRKQVIPFVPACYIRTFDVISDMICFLLRRKRRIEFIALYPKFDVISEVNCALLRRRPRFGKSSPMWSSTLYPKRFPSTKGTLWVFWNFCFA